jgi:hypothetical protein
MVVVDDPYTTFLARLRPLIGATPQVVVVERLARGGGATRWFSCGTIEEVEQLLPDLRPGSRVGFFLDDRIRRERYSHTVEEMIWGELADVGEVFVGRVRPSSLELDVQLLDLADCAEALAGIPIGEVVYVGTFPAFEDDGQSCLVFTPPDTDGVVRRKPV